MMTGKPKMVHIKYRELGEHFLLLLTPHISFGFEVNVALHKMMIMRTAAYWVDNLQLLPHPEGGFYKETYRSEGNISSHALPTQFGGDRSISTAIYFLLRSQDKSMFHKIKSDELWHFHAGSSLTIYVLNQTGLTVHKLGLNLEKGELPQVIIPAMCWFGATVDEPDLYTLASCTVAPGFHFSDFELAKRDELIMEFPAQQALIKLLTA